MEEFHLGFLMRNLLALEPGKQKSRVKSTLWREAAPHMILETVIAMCLLASDLGFGPSWDTVAWIQLSRTELVVESERLSDQAVRRLRKADNLFCSYGLSPHGDQSSSLCCICCHRVYVSSLHVCCVPELYLRHQTAIVLERHLLDNT